MHMYIDIYIYRRLGDGTPTSICEMRSIDRCQEGGVQGPIVENIGNA